MNPCSTRLLLPALLLFTVLSASCGGSKASPNPAAFAVPKWQLSGTVAETGTTRGLAEARIELADGPDAGASASTDSSGRYTLAGLLMPDGRVAHWTLDSAELLEDYPSLLVRGGSWKAFRWNLIYDGLPQGTLTTVVHTTDADGEQYRATGSASVGDTNAASASAPLVRSRRPSMVVPY